MDNLNEMNQYLNTEIVCTLAGLGYAEGNEYYKSPDCLESLKDLIKFLRRDDSTCEIRRQLGRSKVLQNDLVDILKSCTPKEADIFNMVIRLMVNLTQPAVLCWEGQRIPDDKTGQHYHLELVNYLQAYKEAFTDIEVMAAVGKELAKLLQKDWDSRDEEDYLLIERILLLIRNVLHVPFNPQAEKRTDDDASIHDQVIWSLHQNGIDDLLLYIAGSPDERRWCMHTLEIISLMLREQNPESLAKAGEERSQTEKREDERQLQIMRERELAEKRKNTLKYSGRHSRFGGTFTVKNMMSVADKREVIYHRSIADAKNMSFDREKNAPKKRKTQITVKEMSVERKSTLSIRLFLKDFCTQFLEHCYNPLLYIVRDNLLHERSQENDESYFLWAMKFFMEFTRHYGFRVDFVGETMSVSNFQYVLKIVMQYYESFLEDKKDPVTWGRRLHLAVQAYKELLMYVLYMDDSKNENLRENAKVIKANVFYVIEYREIFMLLLRKFEKSKQSKAYLRDLVETFHVFLKMLERFCSGKSHVVVQQKKKARRKKKKSKKKNQDLRVALTPEQAETMWQGMASELSSLLQGHAGEIPESAVPFDAASDVTMEQQRITALSKIQTYLQGGQYGDAVAFVRAAREIWPNDSFGTADMETEDEFMCLHDIFKMTDLPQEVTSTIEEDAGDNEEEIPAEEEEMEAVVTRETHFDYQDFLNKLANPSILQPYCWLLKFYQENSSKTNHYIVKMLHRIAVDLKMYPMLFQLSLFTVFNKILQDNAASQYKELVTFSRYIVGKFFALLPKNPVLCVELAVWKTADVCYELTEGYGSLAFKNASKSKNKSTFSFEEEEEVKKLYHQFQEEGGDVVDKILENLSDDTRTRRQIINKLVSMKLVEDRKTLRKKSEKKSNWSEEEQDQLRAVYEEYKNCEDGIVEKILEHLTNTSRSRRQVVNQLVKMGLVEDRKALRKKRKPGERKKKRKNADEENEGHEEDWNEGGQSNEEGIESAASSSESDSDEDDTYLFVPMRTLVKKIKDQGLGEQIEWIQNKLRRTADDREDDVNSRQAIPLVTITEENEEALGNREFIQMLKKIGFAPPANEQETFWRIPSNLTHEQMRKSADDLDGKPQDSADTNEVPNSSTSPSAIKSNQRKNKLAALAAARKEHSTSARKRKERNERTVKTPQRKEKSASKGRAWRKALANDAADSSDSEKSEDERNDSEETNVNGEVSSTNKSPANQKKSTTHKTKRRVRAFTESDEEVEEDEKNAEEPNEGTGESADSTKSPAKSNKDKEGKATKKRKFLLEESDEEEENGEDEESRAKEGNERDSENDEERESSTKETTRALEDDDDDDDDDVPLTILKKNTPQDENENNLENNENLEGDEVTARGNEISTKRPRVTDDASDDDEDDVPLVHHKKIRKVVLQDDEDDEED